MGDDPDLDPDPGTPALLPEFPFRPDLPIRTARLVLRPWRPRDAGDLAAFGAMFGDPGVVRYLTSEVLGPVEAAAKLADRRPELTGELDWMNLAVEVAASGEVVGDAGLAWTSDGHRQAEIGYSFAGAHHGHGYATEAASSLVDLAFTTLGAHRVCGRLDARNAASGRVLERLGMRREAHLVQNEWVKGEWTDEVVYAVLAREWAERHA